MHGHVNVKRVALFIKQRVHRINYETGVHADFYLFCITRIAFIIQHGASLSTDMLIAICSQPIAY